MARLATVANHVVAPAPTSVHPDLPLREGPDPRGLLEYSVVYTDRALNHMSSKYQDVMCDLSRMLKAVYHADSVALVPGSGTYAMEAVARQFGTGRKCLVIRNGYFSYRWSQIFEMGSIPSEEIVLKAQAVDSLPNPAYAPCPVAEVVDTILRERPEAVFAPHVETSSGIVLPDGYIRAVADATHRVGGIFVVDIIASGCMWVDMESLGADVLVGAPQKSWSGTPCCGVVMMSPAGRKAVDATQSTCFAVDLKKWVAVMEAYERGGHMYHATMPTDAIARFRDAVREGEECGFDALRQQQAELGRAVRGLLARQGFKSVAAEGFQSPSVAVFYTHDDAVKSGEKFRKRGIQVAAGVPLMVDDFTQSAEYKTFRLGLFGYEKLRNIDRTVRSFAKALDKVAAKPVQDDIPTPVFV